MGKKNTYEVTRIFQRTELLKKKKAMTRKDHSAKKYLSNVWLVLKEFLFTALKYCAVKGSYEIPLFFFFT